MAQHIIKMTEFFIDQETGVVALGYEFDGQGDSKAFDSVEEMVRIHEDPVQTGADAMWILVAFWLAQNPTGDNPALMLGKDLKIDFDATPQVELLPEV